jgi:hypothetical protein
MTWSTRAISARLDIRAACDNGEYQLLESFAVEECTFSAGTYSYMSSLNVFRSVPFAACWGLSRFVPKTRTSDFTRHPNITHRNPYR